MATREILFGGEAFRWSWWRGERLSGTAESPVAFDTETEVMRPHRPPLPGEDPLSLPPDPLHVPRPALGMAYDGVRLVCVHPSRFGAFVQAHRTQRLVGHNLQFDFWVVHDAVDRAAREALWSVGDRNGLSDTMILDMLLQLGGGRYRKGGNRAGDDAKIFPSDLGTVSAELGCGVLDKDSPYRLRFGEWVGLSEEEIDAVPDSQAFLSYALADVIATHRVYRRQYALAVALMRRAGWSPGQKGGTYEIRPDALAEFGPLSEYLQVKASVALARLSRTPLRIDRPRRDAAEAAARVRFRDCLDVLTADCPGLLKTTKDKFRTVTEAVGGRKVKRRVLVSPAAVKFTERSAVPQMNNGVLAARLAAIADALNVDRPVSGGKKKGLSLSAKRWAAVADRPDDGLGEEARRGLRFLRAWVALEKEAKLLEFLTAIDADAVYSNYGLLKRTGRTSAGAHRRDGELLLPSVNVQQMPREDGDHPERSVRSLFLPPAGAKWASVDYGYVELRSLAAVCRARFGWSRLGDAIEEHTRRGGIDPHQRTAAAILGIGVEDFLRLPKDAQKKHRQAAKACNFGRPGGLGDATFVAYAKASYGATFTRAEARAAKKKWLDLYPEIKLYLEDRTREAMEWQTGRRQAPLSWLRRKRLGDFLRGGDDERRRFDPEEAEVIWDLLGGLAAARGDDEAVADVEARRVTAAVRSLVSYRACSLTGRVRGNVKYTDNCNTPFQGAAADGAKLALWNLTRRGYRLLAFVHDAFDVAVDPGNAAAQVRQVTKIMCESMEAVLGQSVPVAAEAAVGDCWSKG